MSTLGGDTAPAGGETHRGGASPAAEHAAAERITVRSSIQNPLEQPDQVRHHRDQRRVERGRQEPDDAPHRQRVRLRSARRGLLATNTQAATRAASATSTHSARPGSGAGSRMRSTTRRPPGTVAPAARSCSRRCPRPGRAAPTLRRSRQPGTTPNRSPNSADLRSPTIPAPRAVRPRR